jgi:hypothetical protein
MKIRVNDTEIEIFSGARVKDVLLKFSKDQYREVSSGRKIVTDKYKNPVDLQGELSDAQQLYLNDAP